MLFTYTLLIYLMKIYIYTLPINFLAYLWNFLTNTWQLPGKFLHILGVHIAFASCLFRLGRHMNETDSELSVSVLVGFISWGLWCIFSWCYSAWPLQVGLSLIYISPLIIIFNHTCSLVSYREQSSTRRPPVEWSRKLHGE